MWVEKKPEVGDTVKITWAPWYQELLGQDSVVGVVKKCHDGQWIVDVGPKYIYIPTSATVEVSEP